MDHTESNHPPHAIIIGAGIAGIAGAIRLAVQGFAVSVFEKNDYPGGKLSQLVNGDFYFDAGPSLFTQPHLVKEVFDLAGEKMEDHFSYTQVPVSCHYFYEDGTRLKAYADHDLFAKELNEKLGEEENKLSSYLNRSGRIYNDIGKVFLNHSLHKRSTAFQKSVFKALKATRFSYLFGTMHDMNASHFKNEKTVQLFDRYATYNGSNPYRAPGMLSLIPHVEHNEGVFYPKGGMISITNALISLAEKKGVKFYFGAAVQRIIFHDNKVHGIVVNDENIAADIVVSNMDVYFTYKHLLNREHSAHKVLKQERSSSALIFYWGMKKEFPQLGLHNIFFAKDYKAEFDHLFRLKKIYADPTVYINITSKCEPGMHAPEGKENWFVMVNAPANTGQDWQAYRNSYRETIIAKLNRILNDDIGKYIETEDVLDPVSVESKTGSYMGSLYGTSSNSRMAAFLRHPNFSKKIKGLYFVGGSVHPGGGIPLCLQSARIMGGLVQEDQKGKKH
ncbi:phytoene desaturase [Sediminibacterium roseum]|uniref:Phytoene desaturase n=1 Tax=Sediminibacterium roseum TaxID=1978412 RepID=A0ABW9ZR60_9BACT|nr:1-hydroxycarotenoid 3,4-desaturase CrtD [Sediminibacterium roseum]NCI48784.1 phytoene desaturase [Sediminibacterium roseum]